MVKRVKEINKALKAQVPKHEVSPSLRDDIYERDDYQCVYCLSKAYLTIDHVTPRSWFPTKVSNEELNDPTNLVTACDDCNLGKGQLDLSSFAAKLRKSEVSKKVVSDMVKRVIRATKKELL